jgi:choline-glycine betaine transporter
MVSKKPLSIISILCAVLFISGFIVTSVYAADTCIDCHQDSKFRVQNKMIYDYFNRFHA